MTTTHTPATTAERALARLAWDHRAPMVLLDDGTAWDAPGPEGRTVVAEAKLTIVTTGRKSVCTGARVYRAGEVTSVWGDGSC